MQVGIIGRTKMLYKTMINIESNGHMISFIYCCKDEEYNNFPIKRFKEYAKKNSIPYFEGLDIKENIPKIKRLNTDVCISINWINILEDSQSLIIVSSYLRL